MSRFSPFMIPLHRAGTGHYTMIHPHLGELNLTKDDFGWVAESTGLEGKRITSAKTLHDLRKKLEKLSLRK